MPKGYRHNNTSLRACLCPAFAGRQAAGRRQAGGRQGVLFTLKQPKRSGVQRSQSIIQ